MRRWCRVILGAAFGALALSRGRRVATGDDHAGGGVQPQQPFRFAGGVARGFR